MAKKVKITADSTCDLSRELIDKYDIAIIPLHILLGERSLLDGIEVQPQMLFEHVSATGELPKTAAVSELEFAEFFKGWLDQGYEVVHVDISSEFSSCYQNARLAADGLEGVYIVDSRNLSTGVGHVVLKGAELAAEGLCAKDVHDRLVEAVPKLDVSFVIDTLEFLRKGGRCSTVAAISANLLSLKPCIEVKDGLMGVGKKYRGTLKRCFAEYVKDKLAGRDDIDTHRIFVTHTVTEDRELVEHIKEIIAGTHDFDEVIETTAGCTVSGHCGPNTLGVLFFTK